MDIIITRLLILHDCMAGARQVCSQIGPHSVVLRLARSACNVRWRHLAHTIEDVRLVTSFSNRLGEDLLIIVAGARDVSLVLLVLLVNKRVHLCRNR